MNEEEYEQYERIERRKLMSEKYAKDV